MDVNTGLSDSLTELLLARVVHVIDPFNFWIQIGTRDLFERFSQLEDELQEFCEECGSLNKNDSGWMEDKLFVVARSKLHDSGVWRRAQIARQNLEKGTVDVLYLDYGTTEIVHLDQICAALPAFFFAVDHQAWMCGLAGIRPIAKTWTSRGTKYFQKITKDVLLQASVVSYQAPFNCLQMALYTNEGGDGRSLAHQMLEEEMAMPSEIETVAEYARDVNQVVPQVQGGEEQYEDVYYEADVDSRNNESVESSYDLSPSSQHSYNENHHEDSIEPSSNIHSMGKDDLQITESDSVDVVNQLAPEDPQVTEPESPSAAIPGFNLNTIFKTKMACANQIEQKKEDARKKAVTTAMEKDLEMVQKDMDEVLPDTEITEWEASDYNIGKQSLDHKPDVCYQKVAEIREAIGDTSWSPSMTEGHGPHKPVLQEIKASQVNRVSPRNSAVKPPQLNRSQGYNNTESDFRYGGSPSPGERLESTLSKQLSKILDEGDLQDPGTLCHQFNKVVQPGGLKEPMGLAVVIEVLLETAVTLLCPQQVTVLNILDTYADSPNFDVRIQTVLRHLENTFVKPSFGKAKTYYKEFGQVMGQLLILSRLWNKHASDVTQEFVQHLLEKWAIYNRNGYQMGVQNEKTQQVFTECLEGLWDVAADTITSIDPSTFVRVQEWLQDKVLAQNHPREIRERVLKLLLKLGPVKVFTADQVRPRTTSVEVQTEVSSFSIPDPESSAQSHPEDSSLFSHFDTEIEDESPIAENRKPTPESSPVCQSATAVSYQAPVAAYVQHSTQTIHKFLPSHNAPAAPYNGIDDQDNLTQLNSWAHSVNMSKKKSKKLDLKDTKDMSGLKALALQTLNGEKYVFSGRYVKDLPPRFKKHLSDQQQEHLQNSVQSDPHFYRKGQSGNEERGLDYQTPKEKSETPGEVTPTNDDQEDAQTSDDKSYYTKLGLGDFPSVKDILNSSMEQTDSGSDRDTPRPRAVTPDDWWNRSSGKTDQSRVKPMKTHHNTPSPKHNMPAQNYRNMSSPKRHNSPSPKPSKGSWLNPHAQEWSPKTQDHSRSSSQSPAPVSESSSSGDSVSYHRKPLYLSKPKAAVKGKAEHDQSINAIVMDIFGDGDGDGGDGDGVSKVQSQSQKSDSEVEKLMVSDSTSETSTSFSVSEIASEVEEEKSISDNQEARILPKYEGNFAEQFDYEDEDDDFDDGFFVSGFDPQTEGNNVRNTSSCVDTGSSETQETQSRDEVQKWEEMDYSKPMTTGPTQTRAPRYNWVPGQRKCTLCGESDHTVYSCKRKKGVIF